MKTKLKGLFSTLLCAAMVLGMIPMNLLAADLSSETPSSLVEVAVVGTVYEEHSREMLQLINQEREKVGLQPFTMTATLEEIAERRGMEGSICLYNGGYGLRPDGTEYSTIIDEYGITCETVEEIITWGYGGYEDTQDYMNAWMTGSERDTILSEDFTHIGIGCFEDNTGLTYWSLFLAGNPSDTEEAAAESEDYIEVMGSCIIDTSLAMFDGLRIEFDEPEIALYLGEETEFDLVMYDKGHDSEEEFFVGVVIASSLDMENGVSITNEAVTINDENMICVADTGTVGDATLTVQIGDIKAEKVIHISCNHSYGEPVYTWADDNSTCNAAFTCPACGDIQNVECDVAKNPEDFDCTEGGALTYKTACTFKGEEFVSEKTVTVAPTDHKYNEPEAVWTVDASNNAECAFIFTCTVCRKTYSKAGEVNGQETTEPTCTEKGQLDYTATCTFEEKDYTAEHSEEIAALGHEKYIAENDGAHIIECSRCELSGTSERCTYENGQCIHCEAKEPSAVYRSHVQTYGDQEWVSDGKISGTVGESKRMEAVYIDLENVDEESSIQYCAHVQRKGWLNWRADGDIGGTIGESLRVEAIKIQLTGPLADNYDVYYRVHAQQFGWLDWAKNGEPAGTAGYSYRLEGIQIMLVRKGDEAPGYTDKAFREKLVEYQVHVQSIGDQKYKFDGDMAGTSGRSLRLEGIRINLPSNDGESSIQYRTHVQTYGWQDWVSDNALSGTSGESKRLEAIQIKLDGVMAENYDVYYRVHAQRFGWLGWAKNGESAGTAGYSYRLEAIEIVLVEKGGEAPGSTETPFIQK